MSAAYDDAVRVATALFPDERLLFQGLDPVLSAHLSERLEADPGLREYLAVAAMGRMFGWDDE